MPAAVTMRRLTPEQLEVARKAAQAARDFDVPPLESSAGWTFSRKQLRVHTRSRKEGIKATEEAKRRFRACELISKCSQMLKIPTQAIRVMTTAQTFFHRYYLFHNIVEGEWDFMDVATACLFLATKVEEHPKFLKHVLQATYHYRHGVHYPGGPNPGIPGNPTEADRDKIRDIERDVVAAMGFDLHVVSPHPKLSGISNVMLKACKDADRADLQAIWNVVVQNASLAINDAFYRIICLQHEPKKLALIALAQTEQKMVTAGQIKAFPDIKDAMGAQGPWWNAVFGDTSISREEMAELVDDFELQLFYKRRGQGKRAQPESTLGTVATAIPSREMTAPEVSPNRSSDDSIVEGAAPPAAKKARVEAVRPAVAAV